MARQYVAVKFRPGDKRSYTYHNDGEPVKVVTIGPVIPIFETKAILGLAPAAE